MEHSKTGGRKLVKTIFIMMVLFLGVMLIQDVTITCANEEVGEETEIGESTDQFQEEEAGLEETEEQSGNSMSDEIIEYRGFSPDQAIEDGGVVEDEETLEYRGLKYE